MPVLGSHVPAIEQAIANSPIGRSLQPTLNTSPNEHPAGSPLAGLRHLQSQSPFAVMVLLAVQPMLDANDLAKVWRALLQSAGRIEVLWPAVHGVPCHPIVMSERVAQALLSGEVQCLKHWHTPYPGTVRAWATDNTHHTFDLDTLADLQALRESTDIDGQQPKTKSLNEGKPQSIDAAANMQGAR